MSQYGSAMYQGAPSALYQGTASASYHDTPSALSALYQGTASAVPQRNLHLNGFSRCRVQETK